MVYELGAVVAVVVALMTAIKKIPALVERTWLLPFISGALGAGLAVAYLRPSEPQAVAEAAFQGLLAGLAASGAYDAARLTADRNK